MGHLLISKIYGYCIYALAVFTKKIKPKPNTLVFNLGFDWRKEWDSLRDIISLHLLPRDSSYTSLIFIVPLSLSLAKKHIYMMKGKTGIQPLPASGSPTAGFSLTLKCERRQQVAALLYPNIFLPKQKSGIRSATLFLFTCFRSTSLILLSYLLFHCRYHSQKTIFI